MSSNLPLVLTTQPYPNSTPDRLIKSEKTCSVQQTFSLKNRVCQMKVILNTTGRKPEKPVLGDILKQGWHCSQKTER